MKTKDIKPNRRCQCKPGREKIVPLNDEYSKLQPGQKPHAWTCETCKDFDLLK